jgi:hypothetical protein
MLMVRINAAADLVRFASQFLLRSRLTAAYELAVDESGMRVLTVCEVPDLKECRTAFQDVGKNPFALREAPPRIVLVACIAEIARSHSGIT